MASGFSCKTTNKCQHVDRGENSSVATYLVQEKQDLCDQCATNKQDSILETTGSRDEEWRCEKHQKTVEYICRSHNCAICQTCAFISHQRPCDVQDVQDAVKEKRDMLDGLLLRMKERCGVLQQQEMMIRGCGDDLMAHFNGVREEVCGCFSSKMEKINEEEREEEERIQKEVDEKMKKLKEEIETRLLMSKEQFEEKRQELIKVQQKTTDDLLKIEKKARHKIDHMISLVKLWCSEVDNAQQHVKKILCSKMEVMRGADKVESAWVDANQCNFNVNLLKPTARIGKRVQFDAEKGTLLGTDGSWELIGKVPIPKELIKPYFIGSISDQEMVVSDIGSRILYVTNLLDRTTRKVLECPGDRNIVSCMSLDEGTILCGNYCKGVTGSSFKGASLYNTNWDLMRDVQVPKKRQTEKTFASVRVDESGRIIAAVATDSNIHIINPKNGTVEETVKVGGKQIQWLSSSSAGKFFAKTGNGELAILESFGRRKSFMQKDKWDGCLCDAHPLDETLYVVYRDGERGMYAVDEVKCDGDFQVRKILEYPISSERKDVVLPCVATRSGNLVTCNGEDFFVFKLFSFDDIDVN